MSAAREIACHVGCRGEAGRRRKADDAEGRDDVFVGLNGVVFHQAYHHQHPWILKSGDENPNFCTSILIHSSRGFTRHTAVGAG